MLALYTLFLGDVSIAEPVASVSMIDVGFRPPPIGVAR